MRALALLIPVAAYSVGTCLAQSHVPSTSSSPVADAPLRSLAGCYRLWVGGNPAEVLYYTPAAIRLEVSEARTISRVLGIKAWQLTRLDSTGARAFPTGTNAEVEMLYWTPSATRDSVRLVISSGFSGAEFTFATATARPDTLWGVATAFGDAGPWRKRVGDARAIRFLCHDPAELPRRTLEPTSDTYADPFPDPAMRTWVLLRELRELVHDFRMANGRFPAQLAEIALRPGQEPTDLPLDGWGDVFRYERRGAGYELRSAGRDGRYGNPDDLFANQDTISPQPLPERSVR